MALPCAVVLLLFPLLPLPRFLPLRLLLRWVLHQLPPGVRGRGRGLASTPVPVSAPALVGARVEKKVEEKVSAESAGVAPSPSPEMVDLPTSVDRETPVEWGDSEEPMDAGEAGWNKKPLRKRQSSGEHEEGRGHKEAPSIPLTKNRFEALAGSVEGADQGYCTNMDLEPASPLPYPVSWDADSILDRLGKTQAPPGEEDSMDLGGAGAP
ncbi:hypothetical protein AAFF_G00430870 [Aldrovandia affinis]|uniref:Uncharacterized protein n=1 Tax=Aldrovandia affinis TaxID=143900 RepID=A0AAD7VXR0_9TELE|nr:hypothetical protein AAFF_G00430870 [Aldrovandia affinis]